MLEDYKQARAGLIEMIDRLGDTEKDKVDRKLLNGMKNEVEYIIKWLRIGYDPENPQGVNVRDIYNINKYPHMEVVPDIYEQLRQEREELHELTPEEKQTIDNVLRTLSDRERDCFLLRIQGLRLREIADELNISLSSVQTYIERADEKIKDIRNKL